jgi:hypothetical protein
MRGALMSGPKGERVGELNLIRYPTGRWGFVGPAPSVLTHKRADGSEPTAEEVERDRRLPDKLRKLKTVAFETQEEATKAAAALGHEVVDAPCYDADELKAAAIGAVVREHLPGVLTLEERRNDRLDFHDVHVSGLRRALEAAYDAGARVHAKALR